MKNTKNILSLLMVSSCLALTLSACNKEEVVVETTPVETVDEFSVNQQIGVENITVNDNKNTDTNTSSVNSELLDNNSEPLSTEAVEMDGVAEESLKAEIDESIALEESLEYEEYINSDERIEIYMTYDRTEGDNLIVYYLSGDEEATAERVELSLKISNVTEGIDELNQGDEVCIIFNGAFSDDNSEFLKVFKVINVTKELEALEASVALEEDLEEENLELESVGE